jgi:hypothetical protein
VGADGRRLSVLQAAALLVALLVPAAPAAAAEPGFEVIDAPFSVAQVIDLDRDRARDLVVLAADPQIRLDWWSLQDGDLELVASLEPFAEPTTFDIVWLRPVEWAGRPRLLLLLAEIEPNTGQQCCTTMYWIDANGRRLAATPIAASMPDGVEALVPLDTENDGTDELLVVTGIFEDNQAERPVQLLRFAGGRLAPVGGPVQVSTDTGWSQPGDTDGLPGAEVVFGPDGAGELLRLGTAPGGELRTETAELPDLARNGGGGGWVVAASEGQLVVQTDGAVSVMTWPVGGTPAIGARTEGLWAMGPAVRLEDGSNVIAVQSMEDPPTLSIVDMHLEERGGTAWPSTTDAWWDLAERHRGLQQIEGQYPAWGYVGPLGHGGIGWMIEGSLLRIGDDGIPERLIEGGLAGIVPVGPMGPDDRWMVLVQRSWGFSEFEYLPTGREAAVGGLVVVPLEEMVRPTSSAEVRLAEGAVTLRRERVAVAEPAISLEVEAPVGSRIVALLNDRVELDERSERELTQLTMAPRGRRIDDDEMEALVVVTTPLGRSTVAEWTVEVMRGGPRLEVTEETAAPGLASVVRGTTDRGATVEVDGRPVAVASDGTFSARVDASPWPRDLRVVATSIVGRESVAVLSVVGLFDWRPIPWQAGMALLTVAVGVILFITAGRRRPPPRTVLAGEGDWIEFEGSIGDVTWDEPVVRSGGSSRVAATARERDERVE